MSRSATLLHLLPGKIPPKEDILAIQTVYPTVCGFVCQFEGRLEVEAFPRNVPIDEVMEIISHSEASKEHRFLFFGNYPKYEDENDIQPFVINNEEGAPVLAILIEGKFDKWETGSDNHTGEFQNAQENLFPWIEKLMGEVDNDIDKMILGLKSENIKKKFNTTYDGRGWFQFVPAKGQPFGFGNNQATGRDWGTVSNIENVKFPVKEEPIKAEKKSGLSFMGKPAKAAPVIANTTTPEPEKTDTAIPASTLIGFKMRAIPPQLEGSARNAWIRTFYGANAVALIGDDSEGELPSNHKQVKGFEFPVADSLLAEYDASAKQVKNQGDVKKIQDKLRKAADKLRMSGKIDPDTTDHSKRVSEPASNYVKSPNDYLPTMTPETISKQTEVWMKYLDGKSNKRPSPLEIQKMVATHTPYPTAVGVKQEDMYFLTPDQHKELFGEAGGTATFWLTSELIKAKGVKLEDLVGTEPEKKPADKQVEIPSSQPASAPAGRKSGLGFMNKKSA